MRNGAKTLIIERFPFFGGTATASLMLNINGFRILVKTDGLQTSKGIPEEVILRLKELNGLGKSAYEHDNSYPAMKGGLAYCYAIYAYEIISDCNANDTAKKQQCQK